jgi:hypothetical protein
MAVLTADYGTFVTHSGTLIEVAGAMTGKSMKDSFIFFNGTNITGVEVR